LLKLLFGLSLLPLSAELTLPEYGLLRCAYGLAPSPPSAGRPLYGLRGEKLFFSPPVKLLLCSLLPAYGFLSLSDEEDDFLSDDDDLLSDDPDNLFSPERSVLFGAGLFQSVLSELFDELPLDEDALFGLSSDFEVLLDDLPDFSSRPFAGLLNTIVFYVSASQREGQR
jgi:hypothetical protein